jgi:mannose-6-phosphate isomerase-like protein (cupin superfamily)
MAPFFEPTLASIEPSAVVEFSGEDAMDTGELERQLRAEGFRRTYIWQDLPHTHYPAHTHASLTAHIVLDGEMTLTVAGESRTFRTGERCDVPAGTVHAARMGPQGCRYLIGEK